MHSGWVAGMLLPLVAQLGSAYEVQTPPLDTDWTYNVGTDPWKEYPRPLLRRNEWQSLNGIWKWGASSADEAGSPPAEGELSEDVMIPSCIESGLSGVMQANISHAWFETDFSLPEGWTLADGEHIMMNFQAVDNEATVFVNGQEVGFHRGGYWRFSVDVTEVLSEGSNTLQVFVYDPTDAEGTGVPLGKQVLVPSHIFYTPCTGIWQSVWIERVPAAFITKIDTAADMDGKVDMTVWSSSPNNASTAVTVEVVGPGGETVATHEAQSNTPFSFNVDSPQLWSPSSPTLYNVTVTMGDDKANSYTGFRTIASGELDGVKRPMLNGEFVFQFGTLDQGWWPDGLMTPPNREAMVYDLEVLKDLGLNMVRKHIKVEPELFYEACDRMGLLVIQDMPSMPPDIDVTDEQQLEWERQLEVMVQQLKSHPSITTWVIYNEGWAQIVDGDYPEFDLTERVREIDPSRLINAVSGWHDHGAGDFHDNHHYANPQCGTPFYSIASTPYDPKRIAIQGEFGGIGHNISEEHAWKVQASIDAVNQTYEINENLEAYNYRGHVLLSELRDQVEMYACSAAVYTQTTDVEGEVNGFLTYDRRMLRPIKQQWKDDIQALYDAAEARGGAPQSVNKRKRSA